MKKEIVYIIVIVILLTTNCYWWYTISRITSNQNMSLKKEEVLHFICEERFEILKNEGCKLSPDIIIYDINRKEHNLSKILNKNKKIIIKYSELNCNTCIDSLFSCINNHLNEQEKQYITILATYHNRNDLLTFKRINNLNYPIYGIDSLDIPLENLNEPFIFILNDDYTISHLFIPHKERLQDTRRYFDIILNDIKKY